MRRLAVYLKVEVEIDEVEEPERVARELERAVRRVYGVERTEVTNLVLEN
jgi:hypothetical protein